MTPAEHYREAERLLERASFNGDRIFGSLVHGGASPDHAQAAQRVAVDSAVSSAAVHAQLAQTGAVMLAARGAHTTAANDLMSAISGATVRAAR